MSKKLSIALDHQAGSARPNLSSTRPAQARTITAQEDSATTKGSVISGPERWKSADDILRSAEIFSQQHGFKRVLLQAWFQVTPARAQRASITNYPQDWLDEYRARKLQKLDPILRHATQCGTPFGWEEVQTATPGERRFLSQAATIGLGQGITVPVHGAGGELFSFSLGGRQAPDNADQRWQLFSEVYRFLSEAIPHLRRVLISSTQEVPARPLTCAQREVFVHLMHGKSLKDIARCLGLHIRAVEDRVARACQSLHAQSRTQALARALNSAQIRLFDEEGDEDSEELWHIRENS